MTLQRISALLTDDQEEEVLSLAAEECHELPVTLEGSTVPLIDHTLSSHRLSNTFVQSTLAGKLDVNVFCFFGICSTAMTAAKSSNHFPRSLFRLQLIKIY